MGDKFPYQFHADVSRETLAAFTARFRSRALEQRVRLLRKVYEL